MSARFVGRGVCLATVAALLGCSLVYDTTALTDGSGDAPGPADSSSAAAGSGSGGSSSGASSRGGTASGGASNAGTASGGASNAGTTSGGASNGGSSGTAAIDGGAGGETNTDCGETHYLDDDGDGYGDDSAPTATCETSGYVTTAGDCDDGNALIHPGLPEYCDGLNNDCSAGTDDVCPLDCEWDEESVPIYMHCWVPTSWSDASDICADHAMRLVRVDDSTEQDYLFSWHTPDHAWTGGSDAAVEGVWQWDDGEVLWDHGVAELYSAWFDDEPNDLAGNEHCLMLNGEFSYWNDNTCEYSFGFVCERY